MEQPKVFTPEVLPDVHPLQQPVRFNMANTIQSPLFWFVLGMGAMFGLSHYMGKRKSN